MIGCNCFYCRHFLDFKTYKHKWYLPFKQLFDRIWFFIPKYIFKRNFVGIDGNNIELKPWYGLVLLKSEGEFIGYVWWKKLYFVKK